MTQTTHTPGPWVAEPCVDGIDIYAPKGRIAMLNLDEPEEGNSLTPNARLIVAAPELLEALTNLVNSFEKHRPKEYWDAARAAIAKAKGE